MNWYVTTKSRLFIRQDRVRRRTFSVVPLVAMLSVLCSHNSRTPLASRSPSIFLCSFACTTPTLYPRSYTTRFAYYACDPSITAARIIGVRRTLPPRRRAKNTSNCSRRRTKPCAVPGDGNTTGSCIPRIRIRLWCGTTIRVVSPPRPSIGSIMAMKGGGGRTRTTTTTVRRLRVVWDPNVPLPIRVRGNFPNRTSNYRHTHTLTHTHHSHR